LEGGFEIGLKAHRRVAVTGVLSANQVLRKLKLHERLTIHLGVGIKPAPGPDRGPSGINAQGQNAQADVDDPDFEIFPSPIFR
jgi:hypothetical protein